MRFNIQWIPTIKRYQFVLGGIVIVTNRQSVNRIGYENVIRLVLPQHLPLDGSMLKSVGRTWFRPGKSLGDPS